MAKNYRKSNYEMNKYSKGILYKYADESITKIKFEDISCTQRAARPNDRGEGSAVPCRFC